MASVNHFFIVVLLPLGSVYSTIEFEDSTYRKSSANYTISVVQYLVAQQISTFDCWFYHATPAGNGESLQDIFVGLNRESTEIPKLITNSHFDWLALRGNKIKLPTLVVIQFENASFVRPILVNFALMVGTLPSRTKFIFLISTIERKVLVQFKSILTFLKRCKIYDVIVVSSDEEMMIVHDFAKDTSHTSKFVPPRWLFWDQSRNLNGLPLRYGLMAYEDWFKCTKDDCFGYDAILVKEMARYLNTSAKLMKFTCPEKYDQRDGYVYRCVYVVSNKLFCDFDIFIESISGQDYERGYLQTPLPVDNVLLVPNGRPLNVVELFFRPFQTELWIAFFIGTIVIKMISLLVPNHFRNDVLLLPICGFERYNLNHTGQNEKLVILTLILLFFFISNAYETKIISLMTNKPRVGTFNTFQDILDTKTTVKADHQLALEFPFFSTLYQNGTKQDYIQLDGTSAYMTGGLFGQTLVLRKVNWDYESNQPRYKVMDERFAMVVGFYPLPVKSALKPHLEYVQAALWEAGILNLWYERNLDRMALDLDWQVSQKGVNPSSNILKISDLLPAWLIVWFGAGIGLMVFFVEVIFSLFQSLKSNLALRWVYRKRLFN